MLTIYPYWLGTAQTLGDLLIPYQQAFLQTNESLDAAWLTHLTQHEALWTIDHNGTPVGVIWWENVAVGHQATVHLVLQPGYIRAFWRQNLGNTVLRQGMAMWQLPVVLACFDPIRTQPPKWLTRLGFYPTGQTDDYNQTIWQYPP
jgi:hypothetical protein